MTLLLSTVLAIVLASMVPPRWQGLAALMPLALLTILLLAPAERERLARHWLETRYTSTDVTDGLSPRGIIVPGGSLSGFLVDLEAGAPLDETGRSGRIIGAAGLARRFEKALVVHTGRGEDHAAQAFAVLGVEAARIVVENRSSNTYENARFTAERLQPRPGETWILVSTAIHMPRAMATFRKAGFAVVAYPVDFRRTPISGHAEGVREVLALVAYALQGRLAARELLGWAWPSS